MKVVIITGAGVSSRFNDDIPDSQKKLKVIYHRDTDDIRYTLLYHQLEKCDFADKIIIVGGYKYEDLNKYIDDLRSGEDVDINRNILERISLVYNSHYEDLASGYSLYVGLREIFNNSSIGENPSNIDEIIFIEGDLDFDESSFREIYYSNNSVITYNTHPIQSDKSVVVYKDSSGAFRYAFNSAHGYLDISDDFSEIYNSGQIWKFTDMNALYEAYTEFEKHHIDGTNLVIVQGYLDRVDDNPDVVELHKWTNCNTREDYNHIRCGWEEGQIYVILSDIHGNLPALEAVVGDIYEYEKSAGIKVSGIFLLGDIIDYGMQSNEVVSYIRDNIRWQICTNIWGNHERAVMCEQWDGFSSIRGVECAKYTKSVLTDETKEYLDNNLKHDGYDRVVIGSSEDNSDITVYAVHGSYEDKFWKSISPEDVRGDYSEYDIVMSGHSHIPHVFTKMYDVDDMRMRNKKQVVFINPGSVGQPRNHNPNAQYAIWNSQSGTVELRSVRYDIQKAMSMYHGQVDYFYRDRLETGI